MTERERAAATLAMSQKQFNNLLAGFPADKATYQPTPTINHALWIVGHLAHTEDWIAGKLDGRPSALPAGYDELFAYGSTLKKADAYPPFDEAKAQRRAARERLLAGLRAASDEKLAETVPELETDLLGAAFMAAWHEGWHSGQFSILRRGLNLPSIYEPTT